MRNQANNDVAHGPFEKVTVDADGNIFAGKVIIDGPRTEVVETIAGNSIVKPGSSTRGVDRGAINVGNLSTVDDRLNSDSDRIDVLKTPSPRPRIGDHPDDFACAVTSDIIDRGNMHFINHSGEATSDLVTLMIDAVSSDLRSLWSDMLPTPLSPVAVLAPHFRSAAVLPPTTFSPFSVSQSAAPPASKYIDGPPSAIKRGENVMVTRGLAGTLTRGFGGGLLTFLKRALGLIQTARPAIATSQTMTRPYRLSERPMAFANYDRPHGRGGRAGNEIEKRRHFPIS